MKLSAITVEDWDQFGREHGVLFHCPCVAKGFANNPCDECGETRVVTPINPTAYDTGYMVAGPVNPLPYAGVVAFAHQGHVWFGTRLREGAVAAPFLAMAWLRMFPKSQWLPEQFGDVNSVPDFYSCLPRADADAVVERLRESLSLNLEKSQADLDRLNQMEIPPS